MNQNNIEDHIAYSCDCGSVKFNITKSKKAECISCGSAVELNDIFLSAVSVPNSPLDEALYQCDLMQDEFIRISLLTDNEEIKGLCERAQIRLKTKLSFFERMEKLESKVRKMSVENEALKAALNEVAAKFNALDISEDAKLPTAEEYLAKVLTNKGE